MQHLVQLAEDLISRWVDWPRYRAGKPRKGQEETANLCVLVAGEAAFRKASYLQLWRLTGALTIHAGNTLSTQQLASLDISH
jgi:hypothetical protein